MDKNIAQKDQNPKLMDQKSRKPEINENQAQHTLTRVLSRVHHIRNFMYHNYLEMCVSVTHYMMRGEPLYDMRENFDDS